MQSQAGTLFVDGGLLSELQLKQALTTSVQSGGSLVQNAIRLGFVTSRQVASFFANRLQIPLVEGSQFDNLPAFITRLVPADLVMEHRAIPIMLHQGVIHLAMSDPTDRAALEEISFTTGYSTSPVAAMDEQLEMAMARYYGIPPDDALSRIPPSDHDKTLHWPLDRASQTSPMFDQGPPTLPPPAEEDEPNQSEKADEPHARHEAQERSSDVPRPKLEIFHPPCEDEDGELERFFRSARKDLEREVSAQVQSAEDDLPPPSSIGAALAGLGGQAAEKKNGPEPLVVDEEDEFPPLEDEQQARELILAASERDEVARTLVRFGRTLMPRCLIFVVKRDILVGWQGAGEGVSSKKLKGIMIPLNSPSVFRTARETGADYFGSLPHTTVNDIFLAALGDIRTRQALLIPVSVRHKPICILYGDAGSSEGFNKDLSAIHMLAKDAAQAFERIIIAKKIGRVVTR